MAATRCIVLWFGRDLRVHDHPALAAVGDAPVVPLFVLDEAALGEPGGAARWWLHGSLEALDGALRERGSRLTLRRGPAAGALASVLAETGGTLVHAEEATEPGALRVQDGVAARLAGSAELRRFPANLLHDPAAIRTGSGLPFRRNLRGDLQDVTGDQAVREMIAQSRSNPN